MFSKYREKLFYVKVTHANESLFPKDVYFCFKHGWSFVSDNGPSFLGKIDTNQPESISVGIYSYFSGKSVIDGSGHLSIGSFCSIASDQYFFSSNNVCCN